MAKEIYEKYQDVNQPEILNLSKKIIEKCNEESISVPVYAEKLGLGYMTLRRIVSHDASYSPNIKILYPIADSFECTLSELLSDQYPLKVPQFNSLNDFKNNTNSTEVRIMVDKSVCSRAKYNKFVKVKFFNDLNALFMMTNKLPDTINDPFGCMIVLEDNIHFGYLSIGKRMSKFSDFTSMKKIELETDQISLIGIKENENIDTVNKPTPYINS